MVLINQGSKFTLDHRPGAGEFSVRPVVSRVVDPRPDPSSGVVNSKVWVQYLVMTLVALSKTLIIAP